MTSHYLNQWWPNSLMPICVTSRTWCGFQQHPVDIYHYSDVTWGSWPLRSPATRCFIRDHFVNVPSQWETTLHCNAVSHWLCVYTKWSLVYSRVCSGWHQRKHQNSMLLAHCEGNPLMTGGFPSQRASNMESVSMAWRHHAKSIGSWTKWPQFV